MLLLCNVTSDSCRIARTLIEHYDGERGMQSQLRLLWISSPLHKRIHLIIRNFQDDCANAWARNNRCILFWAHFVPELVCGVAQLESAKPIINRQQSISDWLTKWDPPINAFRCPHQSGTNSLTRFVSHYKRRQVIVYVQKHLVGCCYRKKFAERRAPRRVHSQNPWPPAHRGCTLGAENRRARGGRTLLWGAGANYAIDRHSVRRTVSLSLSLIY